MRALLFSSLLASSSLAAPCPPPKPQRMLSGAVEMLWGGQPHSAVFSTDGTYTSRAAGSSCVWSGCWAWDASTRILTVRETSNRGETWYTWSARFSPDGLSGQMWPGPVGRLELRRKP